ncbi:MAG: hypothetical protein ACXAC6_05155 [Candidatus Hodarchaeales archaeon]|jgi:hypothetical protein
MSIKNLNKHKKYLYSWGILFFLFFGTIGEISSIELLSPSEISEENSQRYFSIPRLTSNQTDSPRSFNYYTEQNSNSKSNTTQSKQIMLGNFPVSSGMPINLPYAKFGITDVSDLNITNITPEVMEKSATSMIFVINFTLIETSGAEVDVVESLTLSNGSSFPITGWTGWKQMRDENGTFNTDRYSLEFALSNSFLSAIALGSYDLIMFTNVSGHLTSDSISLPMRDVHVNIQSVSPPEFNNKLDEDQYFIVDIEVKNETSVGNFSVDFLPINPAATVKSVSSVGFLHFEGFVLNNTPQGEFTLNYSMPAIVAQDFEDGDHELIISVTTLEWISDNTSTLFTAKGTTYHVYIDEITVESQSSVNYDDLMDNTLGDVVLRLNVNDLVNISYHIWDAEQNVNSTRTHNIGYQNPQSPEDPTALLYESSLDSGTGSINLTASDVTPVIGYTLLFFVRGHRTSQESDRPSNITIYWDLLIFNYTYFDNILEEGSSVTPNQKALGLDVNETWNFEVSLYYASDVSSALSGTVSFRFGGGAWSNITDGIDDVLDGFFRTNHTHTSAGEVLFECIISGGISPDPYEMKFVDKTLEADNVNLLVTWTYLIVDMLPLEQDNRLSILTATTTNQTYIYLNATWAHNESILFNDFLRVYDLFRNSPSDVEIIDGLGIYTVLPNTITGMYRYSVIGVIDNTFGITKFTNRSITQIEDPQVEVDLIWEAIEFIYSNTMYNNLTNWDTMGVDYFFSNYGENGTLFVYGRHTYDNSTFNGTAQLFAFEIGEIYDLNFTNGVATWTDDLTRSFEISFAIMDILIERNFGILGVGSINFVIISWDKIVLTLEANHSYSHGTWAEIYVSLSYSVSKAVVDPSKVTYDLLLSNGTFLENITSTMFRDFSFGPANHTYYATNVFDLSTGLVNAEIRFKWIDHVEMDPELGDLTVFWIDDQKPIINQLYTLDLGNGSVFIVLDVLDDTENWQGSGIDSVELFDRRAAVNAYFPQSPIYSLLPTGVHRYFFRYSYNQVFEGFGDSFQFNFNEDLRLTLHITDYALNLLETDLFTIRVSNDKFDPVFLLKNGNYIQFSYPELSDNLTSRPDISDGDVIITVYVQDIKWSGIDRDSVELIITDLDNNVNTSNFMTINNPATPPREEIRFEFRATLRVGGTYHFIVNIKDNAGNSNFQTTELSIEDHVAPRVDSVDITINNDRILAINVSTSELGYGIDYVRVGFFDIAGDLIQWVNLTQRVGEGSSIHTSIKEFYATTVLPIEFFDIFTEKEFTISVLIADNSGNEKLYSSSELELFDLEIDYSIQPLIFHPMMLLSGVIILVLGILAGIRITSRTEGYDMKKIFDDAEKISREIILTQMDEYALGVTVNFFDQVQGPVPVIWEPALLEDQEQVMLDLADKSFSTLEFLGLEETERSGTFDFSTGSYECTALGYSFAIDNPQARGGKENLTVVLLLRKEWGDNLLVFQDEITEKLREIREMIETQKEPSLVEKHARELREFVSRLMLSFNKIYADIDYELDMQEES